MLLFVTLGLLLGSLPGRDETGTPDAPEPAENGRADPVVDEPLFPIDLNRADPGLLEELPGIGPERARAIVERRNTQGPYRSVDQLEAVRGIGPATIERIRELVIVPDSGATGSTEGEDDIGDGTARDAPPRE